MYKDDILIVTVIHNKLKNRGNTVIAIFKDAYVSISPSKYINYASSKDFYELNISKDVIKLSTSLIRRDPTD